jgi:hydroxymethylpyrimidine pyrophosphatase-like HAD family hydrolase
MPMLQVGANAIAAANARPRVRAVPTPEKPARTTGHKSTHAIAAATTPNIKQAM